MALGTPAGLATDTGTTTSTTGAFSQTAGDMLVAIFAYRRATTAPNLGAITDSEGLTWTQLSDANYDTGTTQMRLTLWTAISNGASMTVEVVSSDAAISRLSVVAYPGAKTGYFGTPVSGTNGSGDPSATVAALTAGSHVWGAYYNTSNNAISAPTGFTETSDDTGGSNSVETAFDDSSPSTTMTWSVSATISMCTVIEVKLPVYTISAAAGSYTVTGTAATLRRALPIVAAAGSYTHAGTAATLLWKYKPAADAGSYTVTGTAATLIRALPITASAGSYTHTGADVTLTYVTGNHYTLAADAGAYTVTGTAAGLLHGYKPSADAGSYSHAGSDAALLHGYLLGAAAGSYAVTGADASLIRAMPLTAAAGSYSHSGADAGLLYGFRLAADAGAYSHSGFDATLIRALPLTAAAGSYSHTGSDAGLLQARFVAADAGAYAVSGSSAALLISGLLGAGAGSYAVSGASASLLHARLMAAAAGSYLVTGSDATLIYAAIRHMDLGPGQYIVSGASPDLLYVPLLFLGGSGSTRGYVHGQWNACCDRCGHGFKSTDLRQEWTGLKVCGTCWDPKHPQLSVKGKADKQSLSWTRPELPDVFITDQSWDDL